MIGTALLLGARLKRTATCWEQRAVGVAVLHGAVVALRVALWWKL